MPYRLTLAINAYNYQHDADKSIHLNPGVWHVAKHWPLAARLTLPKGGA